MERMTALAGRRYDLREAADIDRALQAGATRHAG